jgi:GMP synthase (glutamine-hydrolysing)
MIGLVNFYKEKRKERIKNLKEFIKEQTEVSIIDLESKLDNFNGIVLSGSERIITNREYEEKWLDFIINSSIPIIGICYGFQLICQSFGAVIKHGKNIKKEVKVQKLREHILFTDIPSALNLPESHEEYVIAVMEPLIPLMISDNGIEAIAHRNRPIFGTQFHFELSKEYGNIIFRNFLNLIS